MDRPDVANVVASTQAYYDGPADEIYRTVWGDNVHLGIPPHDQASHIEAMAHTNEVMARAVRLDASTRVLDLGCGYGATARYLAATFGCPVTGTNISQKELDLARQRAADAGLARLLTFEYGDFHQLPYADASFDVVWSQESFLHGADKRRILEECRRVLVPGGALVFTDILVRRHTPPEDRQRIYDRVKSPDMWDLEDYRAALADLAFDVRQVEDWSRYVARSYGWVRDQVRQHRQTLSARVPTETLDGTIQALTFWVDSATAGAIGWAFFAAYKPDM